MPLPTDARQREEWPLYDYIYGYFPDALMEEVRVSWLGNQQHNPGQKMHWAREKSTDHMNKALRHIDDYARGIKKDTDGTYHLAKAIWRLKARLQLDIEEEREEAQQTIPVGRPGGLLNLKTEVDCIGPYCSEVNCWRPCGHLGDHDNFDRPSRINLGEACDPAT